jgi:hypothetical protein
LRGNSVIIWRHLLGCIVPRLSVATLAQQGIDKKLGRQGRDVLRPLLQRLAHFSGVGRAIVDSGYACAVTGLVVEHRLYNVWRYAQLCHSGRNTASEVVDPERGDPSSCIQRPFCLAPS